MFTPRALPFNVDFNGDGMVDTHAGATSDVAFNNARPTVHNNGDNVTLLDGHVEWVSFKKLWQVNAGQKRSSTRFGIWRIEQPPLASCETICCNASP